MRVPHQPAVVAEGEAITYENLWQAAATTAACLAAHGVKRGDRVGLLGRRSAHDFIHLLAIWLAGAAYVPLNHKFPVARNRDILLAAGARGFVVGPHSHELGDAIEAPRADVPLAGGGCVYRPLAAPEAVDVETSGDTDPSELAYVLFTSGSTGAPKGVPITFDNLAAYFSNLQAVYPLDAGDRMAQIADLSFDASVHETGWCWWAGATLCIVPASAALMWPRYVQDVGITTMLVVPSAVVLAARARLLSAGALPRLRLVFLGAEALTRHVVRTMQAAAPQALLVNLWGPTEATVAFTHFRIDPQRDLPEVIPIGQPFPGQRVELWDEQGNVVAPGERGELMQSGSQVMRGYWRAPALNAQRFVERGGTRWFRSGDLAARDEHDGLRFLGRLDRQVKIRGYRVELIECESAIRSVCGSDQVAVLPHSVPGELATTALVCFLAGGAVDIAALKAALKTKLPEYMVPARFERVDALPLGPTGKTDYQALREHLAKPA